MALGNAFVFGAQPDDVAEGVYEWMGYMWEGLSGSERQGIIICICAVLFFYIIVRRLRGWGSQKEEGEEKEADEHLRLLEAVQARACENEVLHGKLLNQVYKGKLLKREMRWLRECLRATQEGLQKLRAEHEELRAALTDSGVDDKTSGPEGDGDSRPTSRRTSRPNSPGILVPSTVIPVAASCLNQLSSSPSPPPSPPPKHVCPTCPRHGMRNRLAAPVLGIGTPKPSETSSPSHLSTNSVPAVPRPLRILVASHEAQLSQKNNQSLDDTSTPETSSVTKEPTQSLMESPDPGTSTFSVASSAGACPARKTKQRTGPPEMSMTTRLRPLIDSDKRRYHF